MRQGALSSWTHLDGSLKRPCVLDSRRLHLEAGLVGGSDDCERERRMFSNALQRSIATKCFE